MSWEFPIVAGKIPGYRALGLRFIGRKTIENC